MPASSPPAPALHVQKRGGDGTGALLAGCYIIQPAFESLHMNGGSGGRKGGGAGLPALTAGIALVHTQQVTSTNACLAITSTSTADKAKRTEESAREESAFVDQMLQYQRHSVRIITSIRSNIMPASLAPPPPHTHTHAHPPGPVDQSRYHRRHFLQLLTVFPA